MDEHFDSFTKRFEEAENIMKAKEYANFLFSNGFIKQDILVEISNTIARRTSEQHVFITKPFRYCDGMGESLYSLMRSLSRNTIKIMDDRNEAQST